MKTLTLALASVLTVSLHASSPAPRLIDTPRLSPLLGFSELAPRASTPRAPVTYLGVEAQRVDDTLAAQLGLPDNTGLKIVSIQPGSPAAAQLKPHDILTKFRDQILIEPRQLGVLVRACKDGEEITLTYIRGGKETFATIKLAQRSPLAELRLPAADFHPLTPEDEIKRIEAIRDEVVRRRETRDPVLNTGGQPRIQTSFGNYQIFNFKDDAGTVTLRVEKQERTLTIKDASGKILFEGPISTETERAKIPAELLPRLEKIETSSSFKIFLDSQARLNRLKEEAIAPAAPNAPKTQ